MLNELFTTVIISINVFLLILSRVTGFFLSAPFFSRSNVPSVFKMGFSVIVSYIILPFMVFELGRPIGTAELVFLGLKEITIGIGLGYVAQMFFAIFVSAGALMDVQIGLSMSQVNDTELGGQVTITSRLMDIFAFLIFLYIDGHHYLMRSLINSFSVLPLGQSQVINGSFLEFIGKLMEYFFVSAITVSIPIIISIFLGDILLAFMEKIMPQMNVFIVGMPFKIFLGLTVFIISIPFMGELIRKILMEMYKYLFWFLNIIKG